jgi:hypothetical protein
VNASSAPTNQPDQHDEDRQDQRDHAQPDHQGACVHAQGSPVLRGFTLVRDIDVTGISGTGVVAQGVVFDDGSVVVRWLDAGVSEINRLAGVRPTTVMHENIGSVLALHGHNGATKIVWGMSEPSKSDGGFR